jgi:trans-2,3-dihydro-3-hydroxyanthranilate isomerase
MVVQVRFVTVDVFTDRQFGGNPLAVVLNGDGLTSSQMQAIAGEFNLAETTFVLPPKNARNTAHVRIFTPRAEMPFAGHPNVGTAFALAREGTVYDRVVGGPSLLFEEIAGLVTMELWSEGAATTGARLSAPQPLVIGDQVEPEIVAQACHISVSDIELQNHAPCVASCGNPFVLAEVKSRAALAAAQQNAAVFSAHLPRDFAAGVHLYVRTPDDAVDIQSRMFAPLHGIPEDPATGSANVALIGLLAHLAPERSLTLSQQIGQGVDMGRPSILSAQAVKRDGKVTQALIGGECVEVMRGTIGLH